MLKFRHHIKANLPEKIAKPAKIPVNPSNIETNTLVLNQNSYKKNLSEQRS